MSFSAERAALAEAFANITGLAVFDNVPQAPSLPCLIIYPNDPYCEISRIGSNFARYNLNFGISICVPYMDNLGALTSLEDFIIAASNALPDGTSFGSWSQPTSTELGSQAVLASNLEITIPISQES